MFDDEKKLLQKLTQAQEEVAALAALAERYKMALEAARACSCTSDAKDVVKVALDPRRS